MKREVIYYEKYNQCIITTAGDAVFTVDYSKGEVSSGDEKVELSKNEMQILKLLIENHGEIVSRDEIIDYLWDNKAFVDDNTLTVNMTRIKSKLDSIGIKEAIVTKRGMGYRLV